MVNRVLTAILAIACFLVAFALLRQGTLAPPPKVATSLPPPIEDSVDEKISNFRLPEVRLERVTLEDAFQKLADQAHVNICADWRAFQGLGLPRTAEVNVHLYDITLPNACVALCTSLSPDGRFGAFVSDRTVTVALAESAAQHTVIAYIDVRPLMKHVRKSVQTRQFMCLSGMSEEAIKRLENDAGCEPPTHAEVADQIVKAVTDLVAPESWRDSGGVSGSIRELGGLLIITQTPDNIRRIRELLNTLQRLSDQQTVAPSTRPATSAALAARTVFNEGPRGPDTPALATECFNIQPIMESLYVAPAASHPESRLPTKLEVADSVIKLITDSVAPDSWLDAGGKIGSLRLIGWVLAVTQTPENLGKIHVLLERLQQATVARHFPDVVVAAQATEPPANDQDPDRVTTAYINIRPLIEAMRGLRQKMPVVSEDALFSGQRIPENEIESYLMAMVEWDQPNGSGRLCICGGVLVVTHTNRNLKALYVALEKLRQAIVRNDLPPVSQPIEQPATNP